MSDLEEASTSEVPARSSAVQPVVPGFYSDPTVCRVGDDYYLATSSFEYFPAAPILHSRDLLSWTPIGNIITSRQQFLLSTPGPSTGIYGSTLRHHDGVFWFVTTNVSDFDGGQLIVRATDPAGPWSAPIRVPEAIGIDPDLCWDDDGTVYLTWHDLDFVVGGKGILQAPIDLETGRLLEDPYPVWQGSGMPMAEGPHLYHIGEYWYIVLAEGGTERGHCVTIARGPSPRGPFEGCPQNPILTHRSSSHPVQNTGHADLVQTPEGTWAAVYLGVRPRGSTPGFHVLGRETFLAGVDWVDGWPVFREDAFEVPAIDTAFDEDFSDDALDARWVVPDGDPGTLVHRSAEGGLAFRSHGDPSSFLCARVRDLEWEASAVVDKAGTLGIRMDDRHWCGVTVVDGQAHAIARVGDLCQDLGTVGVGSDTVTVRIATEAPQVGTAPFGHAGPDDIVLSVDTDGGSLELARLDGRYFSTEVAAGFTGRMLAIGTPVEDGRILTVAYRPRAA